MLLGNKEAIATVGVKDMEVARKFYEEKLGLRAVDNEGDSAITYAAGDSKLFVYESKYAGTNKATAVNFLLGDDFDDTVRDLKGKGIQFEHYDLPDTKRQGDVHVAGDMKLAWLKDPDGNILALMNR
ncbi:MAG TPA: VOC family protein [Gemmatimonadaceae bacterium]|nr:VOC family protein [Gemmatimonadaceae bacterium]